MLFLLCCTLMMSVTMDVGAASSTLNRREEDSQATQEEMLSPLIGGCGGVYFLAEPGELVVVVEKRDRNRGKFQTELRALLLAPDRSVVDEATIADDGQPEDSGIGPAQRVRLTAQVPRPGVYVLNIIMSQDRYGLEAVWGFWTNCEKYLIETARGHRDQKHQEPIVLESPERIADICFQPRRKAFTMEVTALPEGANSLELYDGSDALIQTIPVEQDGSAKTVIESEQNRDNTPWRLRLPSAKGIVIIDGLNQWNSDDLYPSMCLWTPNAPSWFSFPEYRWLLSPYQRIVYGKPREEGALTFTVHNNSDRDEIVRLTVEFPERPFPVELDADTVSVSRKSSEEVTLHYKVPRSATGENICHLRANPSGDPSFTTYSTLVVRSGEAPASKPLDMPLMLKPYQHENELFGHLPDYPVESQMYFDQNNKPYVLTSEGLWTLDAGHWSAAPLVPEQCSDPSFQGKTFVPLSGKIAFDKDNNIYLLARTENDAALLHSCDGGKTFSASMLPGYEKHSRTFDIEVFSGTNVPAGPPPVLRRARMSADPRFKWRQMYNLDLYLPARKGDVVEVGEPILISELCLGQAAHSGTPSALVSCGSKVHIVWGEASDPDIEVPGVPGFANTYDRKTRTLGTPVLLGYGPPANDGHNSPSITMDKQGFLHVVLGTHGKPFPYAQSLKPNDTQSGWTEARTTTEDMRQTYIGLVCDKSGTLHLVFRIWQTGELFPSSYYGTLAYQQKRPGEDWQAPKILIAPPFSEYSVYYHRLTIDREQRLFVSYDYWSTFWFYRNDHFGSRRALMMSPDKGETWKMVETSDLR